MNRNQHYRRAEQLVSDYHNDAIYYHHDVPTLLAALTHAVLATVDLDVELAHALGEQQNRQKR